MCEHVQVTGYSNIEEELSGHASEVPFSVEDRIAKVRMHTLCRTCCCVLLVLGCCASASGASTHSPEPHQYM